MYVCMGGVCDPYSSLLDQYDRQRSNSIVREGFASECDKKKWQSNEINNSVIHERSSKKKGFDLFFSISLTIVRFIYTNRCLKLVFTPRTSREHDAGHASSN